jgi:poly(3-hydroxyalkanoate) synthetase
MISWVNPDERHRDKTWDDYMREGASEAIDVVLKETGQKTVNLASYCIGGTLAGTLIGPHVQDRRQALNSSDLLHRAAQLRGRRRAAVPGRRARSSS